MFGDILSDEAAVLVGSLGMLPSASLGAGAGLFEPIHGSAPTIAGQNIANPIGAIASVAMLLRYGLKHAEAADAIDRAIRDALDQGARTKDIAQGGDVVLGTKEMGARILALLERRDPGIQKEDARTPRRRAGDREEARRNP
jgi:3-isopropylmalate dehydrogenase